MVGWAVNWAEQKGKSSQKEPCLTSSFPNFVIVGLFLSGIIENGVEFFMASAIPL